MTLLLLLYLVLGIGVVLFSQRLGRTAAGLALIPSLLTFGWLTTKLNTVSNGGAVTSTVTWLPDLGIDLTLRLDALSAVMLILISGIGSLIFAYSLSYFSPKGDGVGRLIGLLVLFAGSMVGLVLADNLFVLYGFWELTSITSFLLIGNGFAKASARAAALQALLITGLGGLGMLAGFIMLGSAAGTYSISEIMANPPTGGIINAALLLILFGAFTKSAQYPFHSWLPGAMVAPTPVSAYLHSATMVKAGVYLIARLSGGYAELVQWWRPVVIGIGLATMVFGGLRAVRQTDLKVLLAHSTVSQLGFLVAAFGLGTPEALAAGSLLLLAHGAFKAAGFMVVGILDHQYGTRDVRSLPRADRSWLPVSVMAVVAAASMAGVPATVGFMAKEKVLVAFTERPMTWWLLAFIVLIGAASFTAAYSIRFAVGAMGRLGKPDAERRNIDPSTRRPSIPFVVPGLILTAFTLVFGLRPSLLYPLTKAAADAIGAPEFHSEHHNTTLAMAASAIALGLGLALFNRRRQIEPALRIGHRIPNGTDIYQWLLRATLDFAKWLTSFAQPGSLPIYAGVILGCAALLPLAFALEGGSWPGMPDLIDTAVHIPIVATVLIGAIAAASSKRRFSAALFLGLVGYAMAAYFVVQGAADLALTQVAIETLSTVLFVLVLRRLPSRFGMATSQAEAIKTNTDLSRMENRRRVLRITVSSAIAAAVFILAITMAAPETTNYASEQMIERALPEGQGRNVVNVTLVDFRGLDTMGEITVLASAAVGTVALARAGRWHRAQDAGDLSDDEMRGAAPPPVRVKDLVTLNMSVKVLFAILVVASIYLLFAGHNQPGGGFVGGILIGAAVSLRYVAGGINSVRSLSRARPWTVLGTGLILAIGTAAIPLIFGHPVLDNGYIAADLPLIGSVKATSATVFDLGVYLTVLGLALMMFESFGDDPIKAKSELQGTQL